MMRIADLPCIGIDFGTSKCVTTWFDVRNGRAEVLRNAEGEDATPSLVYIGPTETLVGRPARDMLDDEDERANVIASVKSEIASRKRYAVPGTPTPVAVAAHLFAKLKADAERGHFHEPVERAVVTHPAEFDAVQCDRLLEAALQAGFQEVELLPEPVAAAIAYANVGRDVGETVMVYDLGAGTFDLALLARDPDEPGGFQVALPPQGRIFGGDHLDRALYDYCDVIAQQTLGRSITRDGTLDLKFLLECRSRKENLSLREKATFSSYLHNPDGPPTLFRHEVLRADFEEVIRTELEGTIRSARSLLEQANEAQLSPDSILLIGGSSRVPLVSRLLADALPFPPVEWEKRDVAVALGAAFHAHALWNARTARSITVMLPQPKSLDPQDNAHFGQELLRATAAYRAGNYSATLDILQAIQKFDPQNESLLQMMGACYSLTNDFPAGVRVFQQLTRAYSENPYYLQNLGKALEMAGRPDEAVTAYKSSLRLSPVTRAKNDLAALLQRLSEARAIAPGTFTDLETTTASVPAAMSAPTTVPADSVDLNASAYAFAAGSAAMERGEFTEAESQFRLALQQRHGGAGFTQYRALGNALAAQGKWREAAEAFVLALDSSKTQQGTGETIPVMLALASAYHGAKEYVQAERVCRELKKHNTFRVDVLTALGISLAYQPGKEEEAEKVLRDAVIRSQGTVNAHIALARLLRHTQRLQPAIQFLQVAFRARPQDGPLGAELAEMLFTVGDYPGATTILNQVQRVSDTALAREVRRKLIEGGHDSALIVKQDDPVKLRIVVPPSPPLQPQTLHAQTVQCSLNQKVIGTGTLLDGLDLETAVPFGEYELRLDLPHRTGQFALSFGEAGVFRIQVPFIRATETWGEASVIPA